MAADKNASFISQCVARMFEDRTETPSSGQSIARMSVDRTETPSSSQSVARMSGDRKEMPSSFQCVARMSADARYLKAVGVHNKFEDHVVGKSRRRERLSEITKIFTRPAVADVQTKIRIPDHPKLKAAAKPNRRMNEREKLTVR
jgi:hypothetical protein